MKTKHFKTWKKVVESLLKNSKETNKNLPSGNRWHQFPSLILSKAKSMPYRRRNIFERLFHFVLILVCLHLETVALKRKQCAEYQNAKYEIRTENSIECLCWRKDKLLSINLILCWFVKNIEIKSHLLIDSVSSDYRNTLSKGEEECMQPVKCQVIVNYFLILFCCNRLLKNYFILF